MAIHEKTFAPTGIHLESREKFMGDSLAIVILGLGSSPRENMHRKKKEVLTSLKQLWQDAWQNHLKKERVF